MLSVEWFKKMWEEESKNWSTEELMELRKWIDRKVQSQNSDVERKQSTPATWVNGETLCKIYKCLSYNNVKNRKWRLQNNFPYYQDGPFSQVTYNTQDVEDWIDQRKKGALKRKC